MNGYRTHVVLATAAIGAAATWFSAWLTGLYVDPGSWPLRYGLFGVGFIVAVAFAALWMWQIGREQRAAQRYFEVLSRSDTLEHTADTASAELPQLPPSNPWFGAAQRLTAKLLENCHNAQNAEHARAALEVRVQRYRAEAAQVRAVLDSLSEPVVAIDNFDEIVLANPSAVSLLNLQTDDPAHRMLENLTRCEKLVEYLTDTRRRKTTTHRSGEVEVSDADGNCRAYSVTTRTIPVIAANATDDTRSHGAVAVLRYISTHKAEQNRNAEFVSAVSHEMKTPLAGIKAYVELLADGDAEDEQTQEEFLNVINTQTDRLQRLIDNLLNLARIEAGVVNVSKQTRSLNEVLEEAFHLVFPSAEAKQIDLGMELSPLYLGVLADRDMLLQTAINLLSNAIKYTPDGGKVRLRSRLDVNQVIFEVEDSGVGISEEDRDKVFEKFFRVRKDRKMAQGTGLGLPLAKHIIEDVHGGRLTVTSQPGVGSTFRVTLPNAGQIG